ncbi:hypothetical protein ABIB50_002091 [Mucilaginibacter sp. UYCu711]
MKKIFRKNNFKKSLTITDDFEISGNALKKPLVQ